MAIRFLEFIKNNILIIDGAMGTMIQDLGLSDEDFGGTEYKMCSDLLTFAQPELLKDIHLKYFQAGAHAIITNTFGASPLRLQEYNFQELNTTRFAPLSKNLNLNILSPEELSYSLSQRAAEIACEVRETYKKDSRYDGRELFVFGDIGPSNWVLSSTTANLRRATYDKIMQNFKIQTEGLIDGGVDVLIFETHQDPLEFKAAIHGAQEAFRKKSVKLPIIVQVTVDQFGKMQIFNTDILSVLTTVQGIGIDAFGINCSLGPNLMFPIVKKLSERCTLPISIMPNAGLPVSESGKTVFKLSPEQFSEDMFHFVKEFGVNLVGGCCGTTPAHIERLAQKVKGLKPKVRQVQKMVFISGPQNAIALDSSQSLIRIAERLNVRGSQKIREAVEGRDKIDYHVLEDVVHEQVEDLGVPIIDVCMDSNIAKTEETLPKVIQQITTDFRGAICLDSFSVEALLKAINVYPGRPIINSISLEEYQKGLDKIDAIVSKTYHHAPIYIALATGPKGPGVTAKEKFELAKKIFEKCRDRYAVKADQLLVDVNAFPIGSESDENINFALESLKAIPLVKNLHPDLKVTMGVGNLTNGLAKKPYMRRVLTSVFIDEARKQGLDAAIINPHHYVPVDSLDAYHVELSRRVILQRDMEAFAKLEEIAEAKKGVVTKKRSSYEDLPLEEAICQKIKDGFKERDLPKIYRKGEFEHEYIDKIVLQVIKVLEQHKPLDFVNHYLMKTMKELGDGFAKGEVSLPHLLKSADVMKQAMAYIEAYLRFHSGLTGKDQIQYKGTIVLGTVFQDVHSIGKDLVKTLLENYGYRVIDLGVQTPLEKYIEAAKMNQADVIGMSALLVQTSNHMITVAKMLNEAGMGDIDILIGGAPVNKRHAAYVSMHGQENLKNMLPNVFYCASGMDGVNVMNQLCESPKKREELLKKNLEDLKWHYEQAIKRKNEQEELLGCLPRRQIQTLPQRACYLPVEKIVVPLKKFKEHLDLKTLFSLNWRFGGKNSWEKKGVNEEKLKTLLEEWIRRSDEEGWLVPQGVFGIFPCRSDGENVFVFDPKTKKEIGVFHFNSIIGKDKRDIFSAAQYFSNQTLDVIGLQISTGGNQVQKQIEVFKKQHDTESAHFLQGLSDRIAEDMAQYLHDLLRKRMGVKEHCGTRYSPGYPALEKIEMNDVLFKLLKAKEHLEIRLTEAFEFDPPGTTGAVVCFHPEAGYE